MEGGDGDGKRLPTFKCPRDLSLAGKANPLLRSRKNFVPNIPPKRDRDGTNSTSPSPSTSKSQLTSAKTGSPRGRGGRESQGRERKKPDLVQASSIFAEGVGDSDKGGRRSGRGSRFGGRGAGDDSGGGRGGGARGKGTDKVPIGPNANMEKFFRARDEQAGDALSRDLSFNELHAKVHEQIGDGRFLADLDNEDENVDTSLHGVQLPMSEYLTAALEEIKSKPIHVPIKPEDFDPELKKEEGEPSVATTTSNLDPLSFAHALITAPPEGTIVFFQMPDQLPVLDSTPVSDSGVEVREAKLSSSIGVLPEGYIGKMQIFASGATRLVLGENAFDILPAKPVSFRQELVAIDLQDKKMTVLGPIKHKFLCTPDLEQLFRRAL